MMPQQTPGDEPAGKCVEIEMSPDGSFTVSECEPKTEMAMGEEGSEPAGQSYQSMDEALQAAASLLTGASRESARADMAKQVWPDQAAKAGGKPLMGGM